MTAQGKMSDTELKATVIVFIIILTSPVWLEILFALFPSLKWW